MTESQAMHRPPLVSVIIPTFNYARFIPQTLNSIRAQTLDDWECIVVDDGSTDDTAAIVENAASKDLRFRLIRQHNSGQAAARKAGLQAARGKYIQLLDADDLIESDKLRRQSEFLNHHPDIDIVYGSVRYFRDDDRSRRRYALFDPDEPWMPCISGAGAEVALVLLEKNIMAINSPLARHSVFDEIGGFDASLPRADDWDMWLRCALAGERFEYRDEPETLALVRAHSQSLTRRDRGLLQARVAIHRKVPQLTQDPLILRRNRELLEWLERVWRLTQRIDEVIGAEDAFVLIDDETIRPELIGYRALPFTERDGVYRGPPATAEHAIHELARLRESGTSYVVIAWPALWQLELYPAFSRHLHESYACLHRCEDAIIFALHQHELQRT